MSVTIVACGRKSGRALIRTGKRGMGAMTRVMVEKTSQCLDEYDGTLQFQIATEFTRGQA